MKKNILKGILTSAMMATIFIGAGSSAKACTGVCTDDNLCAECLPCHNYFVAFAANHGLTYEGLKADHDLFMECAEEWFEVAGGFDAWYADASAKVNAIDSFEATVTVEMLDLVNADRAANGVGALVWDEELAEYAKQRAVESMNNFTSAEFATAYKNGGDYTAIAHAGCREQTGENSLFEKNGGGMNYAGVNSFNASWVKSPSHHANRVSAEYTKYAAACYVDFNTNDLVVVELFEY